MLVNRAKMTTATTGTGTITLGSAVDGYQTFADAGVSDADVVSYAIEDGTAWEIGTGTYTSSGTTLSRTVSESSNADAAINLTGNALVFVTALAEDIVTPDYTGDLTIGDKIIHSGDTNTSIRFPSADTVAVETAGSERMRVTSTGNVGIGTSNPVSKLDIVSETGTNVNSSALNLRGTVNPQQTNLFIYGIRQANPSADVGSIAFFNDSNFDGTFEEVSRIVASGDGAIKFNRGASGGSEVMRIDSAGNVGIGTTAPASKLDVDGDLTISDKIIHSGDTNTSIRFPAADTVAVETAGSERLRADTVGVTVSGEFRATSVNESFSVVSSTAGAATINCEAANVFYHLLTESVTYTFSNPPTNGIAYSFALKVIQDSTPRTITWPASVKWPGGVAPTVSSGSGQEDMYVFFTHNGGTNWYGFTAGQVLS